MNDFDYDVKQKKAIANMARYKKGTKGRKGCSLPSDNLTKKKLMKMNGEVQSINFNKPISFAELKKMSASTQREYAQHLIDVYATTTREFAQMWGVGSGTVSRYLVSIGISQGKDKLHQTQHQKDKWYEFVGYMPIIESKEVDNGVVNDAPKEKAESDCKKNNASLNIKGTIEVSGDIYEVAKYMMQTFGVGVNAKVVITVE